MLPENQSPWRSRPEESTHRSGMQSVWMIASKATNTVNNMKKSFQLRKLPSLHHAAMGP
jgi:hypothetical protein